MVFLVSVPACVLLCVYGRLRVFFWVDKGNEIEMRDVGFDLELDQGERGEGRETEKEGVLTGETVILKGGDWGVLQNLIGI